MAKLHRSAIATPDVAVLATVGPTGPAIVHDSGVLPVELGPNTNQGGNHTKRFKMKEYERV